MVEAAANELESCGVEGSSSRKIVKFLFRICKAFFMGLDILREMLEDDVRRQSEIMSILTVDWT